MTGPVLWIDVETTGMSQDRHGIVSLSAIADFDGQQVAARTFHMNPVGREIEDSALAVNGFTREQIATFEDWKKVCIDFQEWVSQTFTAAFVPVPVGGYNQVSFDCRFIRAWFTEAGWEFDDFLRAEEKCDVMLMVKRDTTGRFATLENRKLTTVASAMGVALDAAHTAEADIRATRELFYLIESGAVPK